MADKTCPDGHGPMQREPGYWAIQGVARKEGTLITDGEFARTTDGMILKIWLCPLCKLCRIYADDTKD